MFLADKNIFEWYVYNMKAPLLCFRSGFLLDIMNPCDIHNTYNTFINVVRKRVFMFRATFIFS